MFTHIRARFRRIAEPKLYGAHCGRAIGAWKSGEYSEAIRHYQRALEADPDNAIVWKSIGDCYRELNDVPAAREAYQKMFECEDHSWRYAEELSRLLADSGKDSWNSTSSDLILAATRDETCPRQSEEILLELGRVLAMNGAAESAIALLDKAIALGSKTSHSYEFVARMMLNLGEYDKAKHFCEEGLKSAWGKIALRCVLAEVHSRMGNYEEALRLLEPMRFFTVFHPRCSELLVSVYRKLGDFGSAIRAAKYGIRWGARSTWMLSSLGHLHELQGDIQETIDALESEIAEGCTHGIVFAELIVLYVQQRKFASARMTCERLRAIRKRGAKTMLTYIDSAEQGEVSG
ncbi:MAG: tetratricopeptide repeat protein [Candidatus Hydrogenedentes bacterium]|nr:tetratricopeptide repeat protein [Candidatus Hydrogenedentota bacterium]